MAKAPGTAGWCAWARTRAARFTACTVTGASGPPTVRAALCNPASTSGSRESGQRCVPGILFLPSGQQWPEGNGVVSTGMWEAHPPARLPLSTESSDPPLGLQGQSPTRAPCGGCMRWASSPSSDSHCCPADIIPCAAPSEAAPGRLQSESKEMSGCGEGSRGGDLGRTAHVGPVSPNLTSQERTEAGILCEISSFSNVDSNYLFETLCGAKQTHSWARLTTSDQRNKIRFRNIPGTSSL